MTEAHTPNSQGFVAVRRGGQAKKPVLHCSRGEGRNFNLWGLNNVWCFLNEAL
jgi:hypothetical protein